MQQKAYSESRRDARARQANSGGEEACNNYFMGLGTSGADDIEYSGHVTLCGGACAHGWRTDGGVPKWAAFTTSACC